MNSFDVVYRNINGQPVPFIVEKRKTKVEGEPVKAKKKGGKKNV